MIVSSTEIQNNFGRYLMLASKEPITITKNGVAVARLTSLIEDMEEKKDYIVAETRLTSNYIYGGRKASYEEFLKLTENSDDRYEYIDGEIYFLASPKTIHQITLQNLNISFCNYFQNKDCTVMIAPYDITLRRDKDDKNVVQPDLMVICDLEEHLDERDYYMGIPTLVIEVLSESTRSKDIVKKLDLYMKCGVEEYWVVDPQQKEILIYLFKDKEIKINKSYNQDQTASSFKFNGLEVELEEIFT